MMDNEVASYVKYSSYLKRLTAFIGLWPDYQKQMPAISLLLSIQAAFSSFTTFCFIAYSCYLDSADIGAFTSYIGGLVGYLTTVMKIFVLGIQQKNLKKLNNGISASFEANLKVPENRQYLLAHLPMSLRFFYTYAITTGSSLALLVLIPLLLLRHGVYVRMLPLTLPFSYKPGGMVHWMFYLYEILCGWNLWTVAVGTDNLFSLYCLHIVGELKLLSSRFRNLKSSKNYRKDMKDCIQSHMLLMKTFLKLQKVFGFVVMWFAITCALCLCSLVFQAVEMDKVSVMRVFYLFNHSFVKLLQAYLYTWCGNIITVESEICLNAAYEAHWSDSGDKRFMKDILTVVLQRPMVFKANKFMELRMELFLKIVNTSVSYFFLLRTLDDDS
ncbi:odorant receptor 248 [Nasonia vitripennis]|uniref:Odorant receptor n=1 Tax=Nasonia vitripennis TaxID=7425 RepID=A0A7M6UMS9_NASVI|nr:odorant receptor 248 [Nasonia vitripennis]